MWKDRDSLSASKCRTVAQVRIQKKALRLVWRYWKVFSQRDGTLSSSKHRVQVRLEVKFSIDIAHLKEKSDDLDRSYRVFTLAKHEKKLRINASVTS